MGKNYFLTSAEAHAKLRQGEKVEHDEKKGFHITRPPKTKKNNGGIIIDSRRLLGY